MNENILQCAQGWATNTTNELLQPNENGLFGVKSNSSGTASAVRRRLHGWSADMSKNEHQQHGAKSRGDVQLKRVVFPVEVLWQHSRGGGEDRRECV